MDDPSSAALSFGWSGDFAGPKTNYQQKGGLPSVGFTLQHALPTTTATAQTTTATSTTATATTTTNALALLADGDACNSAVGLQFSVFTESYPLTLISSTGALTLQVLGPGTGNP